MKKLLDIGQVLKTFEGEPMKLGDRDFTLKDVLLTYLASAHRMNLTATKEGTAYEVGMLIGAAKGIVELETHQWDVLKKLTDHGKIREGQAELPVFTSLVVSQQAKRLVDAAETKEAKDAKEE